MVNKEDKMETETQQEYLDLTPELEEVQEDFGTGLPDMVFPDMDFNQFSFDF